MANIDITGVWWLPSLPERKMVGTLRWKPSAFPRLELVGSLSAEPQLGCDVKHDIILGVAEQHMITLVNCLQTKATVASPGVYKEKYTATMAFSGFHAQDQADLLFSSLTIGYPNLDRWIGAKCVEYRRLEGEDHSKRRIGVSIGSPEPVQVQVEGATIEFQVTCTTHSDATTALGVKQQGIVAINVETPQELNELWSHYKHRIERFLSFAIGAPLFPESVGVTILAQSEQGDEKKKVQAKVFLNAGDTERSVVAHEHEMLFSYSMVAPNLEIAIRNWFDVHELLRPVFDLYFGIRYNSNLYLDNQFLGISQAIEVYHRTRSGGSVLPEEEWQLVLDQLKSVIAGFDTGSDEKRALKNKLVYMNEIGLRRRIKELYEDVADLVRDRIPSKKSFASEMVRWRNYLTHYSDEAMEKRVRGEALRSLVDAGEHFLKTLLLKDIGFTREQIADINSRNETKR